MIQHDASGLFLSYSLLSSAAKSFTLLVLLGSNSKEKKKLVGPGLLFRQSIVIGAGLRGPCLEVQLWSSQLGRLGGFHVIPHMFLRLSLLLRQSVHQFPLGENHDFIVEDATFKKSYSHYAP